MTKQENEKDVEKWEGYKNFLNSVFHHNIIALFEKFADMDEGLQKAVIPVISALKDADTDDKDMLLNTLVEAFYGEEFEIDFKKEDVGATKCSLKN